MTKRLKLTSPITVPADLWATSLLPEGCIESWLYADGSFVEAGDPIAVVRIEDALHDVLAPSKGRLHVGCKTNAIVEPGTTIGHVSRGL
jgi:pyruvate/2-oxoglutarate dehydrogenase complex dihydrolipoamide acyltransferase (E2) component